MDMCTKPQIKRKIMNLHFERAKDIFNVTDNKLFLRSAIEVYERSAPAHLGSSFVHKMLIIILYAYNRNRFRANWMTLIEIFTVLIRTLSRVQTVFQWRPTQNVANSLDWKSLFHDTSFASFSRHNIKVCNVSNSFIVCLSISSYPISISLYLESVEDSVFLRRGVTSCSRIWPRISRNSTHESLKLPPIRETI